MNLAVEKAREFCTERCVVLIVQDLLRQVGGHSSGIAVNLCDRIVVYAECSTARIELQLAIERAFGLKFANEIMLELSGATTVADLVRYARIRIAKSYSDDQLYELIRLCFGKLVQVTSDQLAGLQKVNDPIIDSLGELDETGWAEWRREIMLRLPIRVPDGFCGNTPFGLWYFLSCELDVVT